MSRFYIANEELEDFLKSIKFEFHDREEEEVKYFTHLKTGKQVRLNSKTKDVAFISPTGFVEQEDSSFTNNQILMFLSTV